MSRKDYKYIYGPVPSWRLGSSLGVDPLSCKEKICSFDCIYCQVGKTKNFSDKREQFVSVEKVIEEFDSLPAAEIDYITFSGTGEPTLAKNLGEMIKAVKRIRKEKIAVITNASLMNKKEVQQDLVLADIVVAKLDACSQGLFMQINKPMASIRLNDVVQGIKEFRATYQGVLALQIMFMHANSDYVKDIMKIVKEIGPDEVQLNTPLRLSQVAPLTKDDFSRIEHYFEKECKEAANIISVYKSKKKNVRSFSSKGTLRRRGKLR